MRALYLGLAAAALVTPAHALSKPDITFILGALLVPCRVSLALLRLCS